MNTYTTGTQGYPDVAIDDAGNFVVVWYSYVPGDPDSYDIKGQRFAASGSEQGAEFLVNAITTGRQVQTRVAAAGGGDFVVVWLNDPNVAGRRFSAAGAPLGGEFQVNGGNRPDVAIDEDGDFVVAWDAPDGDGFGVYGQRFLADGTLLGDEFQINTYTSDWQRNARVARSAGGDFVAVWHSRNQDGSGYAVEGQRFGPDGTPQGEEFQINTYTTGDQEDPSVARSPGGGFVVVWNSEGQDGDGVSVEAQRFAADGSTLGSEFRINATTASNQNDPSISMDADGNFVVTWWALGNVHGRAFMADGTPIGDDFQINSYTTGAQLRPSVARNGAGNFVVVWNSYGQDGEYYGIAGQRFGTAGGSLIFADGFESGDVSAWSGAVP